MNPFVQFIIKSFVAIPVTGTVLLTSLFGFHLGWYSIGAAALGGGLAYGITGAISTTRFLKRNQLTRKEYRYIKKNLQEAKKKINRLNKVTFSLRHISSLKQRIEAYRITNKIYKLTKREPKRFYKAERFYFSHLDSVLELTEKYAFLSTSPTKNNELEYSLSETRRTLNELTELIEQDLYYVLSDDIDHLNFEIDVAKHNLKK
ncbi:5-bromo-4-chloroindolyl phosphate hydrolysis family protein [Pseudoneobacillus sp. C159]